MYISIVNQYLECEPPILVHVKNWTLSCSNWAILFSITDNQYNFVAIGNGQVDWQKLRLRAIRLDL